MKKLHQVSKRPHTGKLSENGEDNWRKWKGKMVGGYLLFG